MAIEGRLQTRQWDDDRGARHWKTEVVATTVEMLSGRRKRDYEAESLASQAAADAESGTTEGESSELIGSADADMSGGDESAESSMEDEQVLVLA